MELLSKRLTKGGPPLLLASLASGIHCHKMGVGLVAVSRESSVELLGFSMPLNTRRWEQTMREGHWHWFPRRVCPGGGQARWWSFWVCSSGLLG